jgi:hypothetical protein
MVNFWASCKQQGGKTHIVLVPATAPLRVRLFTASGVPGHDLITSALAICLVPRHSGLIGGQWHWLFEQWLLNLLLHDIPMKCDTLPAPGNICGVQHLMAYMPWCHIHQALC